jgi:hypothetical protein
MVTLWDGDCAVGDLGLCDAPLWWCCPYGRALPAHGQQGTGDHEHALKPTTQAEPARQSDGAIPAPAIRVVEIRVQAVLPVMPPMTTRPAGKMKHQQCGHDDDDSGYHG